MVLIRLPGILPVLGKPFFVQLRNMAAETGENGRKVRRKYRKTLKNLDKA